MAEIVYALCAIMSAACAIMLLRGFLRNRTSLLFWSSLCFAGLAANNILLFVDLVLVVDVNLSLARSASALASVAVLVFGLVWESR
jgi:hypothetical protein